MSADEIVASLAKSDPVYGPVRGPQVSAAPDGRPIFSSLSPLIAWQRAHTRTEENVLHQRYCVWMKALVIRTEEVPAECGCERRQ